MQASSETKIKRFPYPLNFAYMLLGIGMCFKSINDGDLLQLPLPIGLILVGLLNVLPCPFIVKVIGFCIAIFGSMFVVGYTLMRFILE